MNNLIVKNKKFGNLEIYVDEKGKVWFPATEVAEMLGYKNPHKAILDHCKEHGVTFREVIANTGFGDSKQKKKYIEIAVERIGNSLFNKLEVLWVLKRISFKCKN